MEDAIRHHIAILPRDLKLFAVHGCEQVLCSRSLHNTEQHLCEG
jgi:hypothetical protein